MLRTLFTIGVMAILGLFVMKLVFGILGGVFVIFFGLAYLAFKIVLIGAVAYVVIAIVSPRSAKRLRERFTRAPTTY
jgi:ABC-type proline/glycine betaine transport system permease subunit